MVSIWQDFKQCFKNFPLIIFSLMLYLGLRSTSILPDGVHIFNELYHPAYLGWYDFLLAFSILFSLVTARLKLEIKDLFWGLILITIIFKSWNNTYQTDRQFIIDGIIYFLRFLGIFIFAKYLVFQLGTKITESLLKVFALLLGANAVLWYSLQFGLNNRMAASAMTSPSFGQLMAITCLLAYYRKNYWLLFFAFIFLFLSFSRTSILLFIFLLILHKRNILSWQTIKLALIFVVIGFISIFLLLKYGGDATQVVIASRFSSEEISSLNGRNYIWEHAMNLLQAGKIPLFGIGFHTTPEIIKHTKLIFIDEYGYYHIIPSFHSILVEYILGLGISSLVIFGYFCKRIWQTFRAQCYPSFFIFSFFLFSQSLDFTFYVPKEVIIWSLLLGMAEGQWRYENSPQIKTAKDVGELQQNVNI